MANPSLENLSTSLSLSERIGHANAHLDQIIIMNQRRQEYKVLSDSEIGDRALNLASYGDFDHLGDSVASFTRSLEAERVDARRERDAILVQMQKALEALKMNLKNIIQIALQGGEEAEAAMACLRELETKRGLCRDDFLPLDFHFSDLWLEVAQAKMITQVSEAPKRGGYDHLPDHPAVLQDLLTEVGSATHAVPKNSETE